MVVPISSEAEPNEMTVVIGLIASQHLIFASDGFAIYQDRDDSPIFKMETYNKVRYVGDRRFLLGSAGSHLINFEICNSLNTTASTELPEREFLEQFSAQVKRLNQNAEGKHTSFLMGYFANREPRLYLFPSDGDYSEQRGLAALGSGADQAITYLSSNYDNQWVLQEAVDQTIRAIFEASKIPTVNALPMLSILSKEGAIDLSSITVSMYNTFKDNLRQALVLAAMNQKKWGT
jgi:hypothetical protein